jgi:metal-responsive CopG/Arc/MetJ family transcriptional regulator
MARYNISLPESVVQIADEQAEKMGISRSAFIATAIQFKAQYDAMMMEVPKMLQMIDDIRSGKITPKSISGGVGSSVLDVTGTTGGEGL